MGYKVEPPLVCDRVLIWNGIGLDIIHRLNFFFLCCSCFVFANKSWRVLQFPLFGGPACLLPSHASWDVAAVAGLLSLVLLSCRKRIVVVYTQPACQTKIRRVRHVSNLCACLPPRLRGCSPNFQLTEQAHNTGRMQTSSVLLRKRPGKNAESLLGNVNVVICVVRQSTVAVAPAPPKPKPGAVLLDVYLLLLRDESV